MDDDLKGFNLDGLEEKFNAASQRQGYADGLEQGKRAGYDEGQSRGSEEGRRIGSEIGTYRGHLMVWIQQLQLGPEHSPRSAKLISRLSETLDLIDDFPKSNQVTCESKLDDIRSKLKQITSALGVHMCDMNSQVTEIAM